MKIQILKVSGPFPTVQTPGAPPVDVYSIRFIYGAKTPEGFWQREGLVNIIGDLSADKVKAAIKAFLTAEKPHPLDGQEFEVP